MCQTNKWNLPAIQSYPSKGCKWCLSKAGVSSHSSVWNVTRLPTSLYRYIQCNMLEESTFKFVSFRYCPPFQLNIVHISHGGVHIVLSTRRHAIFPQNVTQFSKVLVKCLLLVLVKIPQRSSTKAPFSTMSCLHQPLLVAAMSLSIFLFCRMGLFVTVLLNPYLRQGKCRMMFNLKRKEMT